MGDFSNFRVLIVDDDRDFADSLSALLQNRGYAVETAVDAAGAGAALERFAAEIALIDLRLGGGDDPSGLDLIADLRCRQPDMICIMMAALAEPDTVVEALRAGADDFLTKPIEPSILLAALERGLAKRKLLVEKQAAEATLRESEARYREIFDESPIGIWESDWSEVKRALDDLVAGGVTDLRQYLQDNRDRLTHIYNLCRVIDISRATYNMYGATNKQALIDSNRSNVETAEDLYAFLESVIAFMGGATEFEYESLDLRVDNQSFNTFCRLVIPPQYRHDWSRVIFAIEDITERKRAEEALRESEACLRAVIDNFPTTIFLKDLEGRFSLVDKRFEEWYGLSAEDIIGKTSHDIYDKPVADAYVAQDKEVLETLSVIEQERDVKRANGDIRRHIITKFPVLDVDGQAIGVGTFDIDITERKRAEDALRGSEQRFRELLESAPDAMIIVNQQGEIVLVNKQTEAVFGYPRDELMGSPVENLISHDFREMHVNLRAGFYADPQILPMGLTSELQGVARDGREFPVEVSLSPIQTDEGVLVAATVRDVTERKQAEEALRESDDRYARAVAGTNDGIWDWNVRTGVDYFSPRCEAILGYGEGELEPHVDTFKDLTHPDELTSVMEAVRAHLEDKVPYDLEFRMRHKDGGYVWIHSRGQATWDDDGKPLRMAGSISDITKRRAAEDELQDSQARMIDAIESFPGGFVLYDAEERLVLCNSKYREFYPAIAELLKPGARLEEVARISFEAGDVMGSTENVEAWMKLRLEHNRTGQGTHEQQLKDGRWLLCSERKTSGGGTVGIRTDITEVKRTGEAIRTRDAWLKGIMENAPLEIVLKDTEGRIMAISQNVAAEAGLTQEDYIGRTTADFLPADVAEVYMNADREVMETGLLVQQEVVEKYQDGSPRHMLNAKFPLKDESGNVLGICSLTTDVTEMKEVQAQLHQAQKMEAVGQLTGGIAHDFNNLLAIVMGNLELIEDEIEGSGTLFDYLKAAFSAADDAAQLTQRLLAFSRTQPLMPGVADMNAMVTKMIGLVGRTLDDAIVIKTTFEDDLAPVFIDASQFENALLNLMVNARHAMPRGGEIYIQTKGLTVGEETAASDSDLPPGDYISLTVRDTGDGMSRDVLEHVFEPFFTTKEVGEGSGLGLSMVFGFVKQSGGHVTIDSEEGQGATVTLYLPTTTGELSKDVKPPICPNVRGGGEMILFVEDDERVLDVIVDHLTGMGYKVQHARDGKSALHAIDEIPVIDLLLTDVILPGGMNGAELAIEARRKLPTLPVLYASGYSAAALMKTGHLDDNAQLIEKPFTRRELAAKIATMLS